MPVAATTVAALRAAFQTRIEGTTPDHARTAEREWKRMAKLDDVPGSQRGYYLSITEQERDSSNGSGVHTSAWASYTARLRVWTGYRGLTDEHWEDAVSADQRQLLVRLSNVTGVITGLLGLMDEGWEDGPESATDARWGAHVFKITYLLDQP